MRPIAFWYCGFESHLSHDCLSLLNVVCFQVEVYETGRSLVQRSPTECVCVCVSLNVSRYNNNLYT